MHQLTKQILSSVHLLSFRSKTNVLVLSAGISAICITACGDNERYASSDSTTSIPVFDVTEWLPGGETTSVKSMSGNFIHPSANLHGMAALNFWTGFSLFRDPWVIAPSSTRDRDGLGPLFNARSCIACHQSGAKGLRPESTKNAPTGLVFRLFNFAQIPWVDDNYGDQIQTLFIRGFEHIRLDNSNKKISSLAAEVKIHVKYTQLTNNYPDGTKYILQQPSYTLFEHSDGSLHPNTHLSPRFAPSIFGTGLLDAIAEQDLIAQEDINDINNDGISPKYNKVPLLSGNDKTKQTARSDMHIGRFGLKAKHPTLKQQIAAAFRDDIGITNRLFPNESCAKNQLACKQVAKLGGHDDVELSDKLLNVVLTFNQHLAPAKARNLMSKAAQNGRTLFYEAACHQCHTPSYVTDKHYPVTELANQKIWPYTNLALHDMGEDLSDSYGTANREKTASAEYLATPREWRTPPLWGIGIIEQSPQPAFLHDGRAKSIEEAILWHGGEANQSKQTFIHMSLAQRNELLTFLRAI
ncbi:di-heme oxidoredictase family protein [Agaribacter marinus]|uniref:Lipoprotein n=1 Tax=Agaribacter marinus TaxID=1431249 RepID=A0AA37SX27_9ALTE|nr:di-heme oxidoredictase family protein [Agaribacter marinus]GLR69924.1 lipoprotein [Agaribacter marinus]